MGIALIRARSGRSGASLSLLFAAFFTFILLPLSPLWAQELKFPEDIDLMAPTIQHEPPAQASPAEEKLLIEATITDNVAVEETTLFYRPLGYPEYSSINMELIANHLYSAAIPREEVQEPGIEYYIQASDEAGNMVMRGFSFSPLIVTVTPALPGVEEKKDQAIAGIEEPQESFRLATEEPAVKPWYKKWWVWTLVAVVIGGAAAASGGGGGGGEGAGAPTLTTGSATISGPIP